MKLGVSTTISTGEIYSQEYLTMKEKLFLTQQIALDFAEKHKLKYVELSILDPYSIKDIDQSGFKNMLSAYSFRYTYHAPIFEINLGATNQSWRKLSVKLLNEHIRFAKAMDIENIVIHAYRPMGLDMFFLERIMENTIQSMAEIHSKNDTGVKILIENLPNPGDLFSSPETLALMENTCYCYDTSHANCAGYEQKDFIAHLGKNIKEVHVIDGIKNHPDMHLPIGKGDIDFKETQKALKNINYTGPVILEAFSLEDATTSIKKLKDIFR
ncbi:MAG: sugar phosphate isomerase/epimerase [archaeon]